MTIEFHDPRGESRVAPEPYTLSHDLEGGPKVGLLANNFPDSIAFLDAVEAALGADIPDAEFIRYQKPGASAPATDDLVRQIATECDVLVTAYGH